MKLLDRLLQLWRISKAAPFLSAGTRVLDVGTADGALFRQYPWLQGSGIDPNIELESFPRHIRAQRGRFPDDLAEAGPFDAITLFAILEHIQPLDQPAFAAHCAQALRPGGRALLTVPSHRVDAILDFLMALRILDGMEVGEHYGYDVASTQPLFEQAGFKLLRHERFQLGLNHFFAFEKV